MDTTALSVTQLVRLLKEHVEGSFPLLWVEGEVSNLARPASGHLYFTLKDANTQIRCAMFRAKASLLRLRPTDGMQVLLRARVTLFEARGDLQLIVEHMEDAGLGALQRAFELLKQRLQGEGLFAAEHKRPLPALPKRIGVITSPSGAAIRDVLHVLARRFPLIAVTIYPSSVQGASAARELITALHHAQADARCDVLLLVRGGGSLEDLQAFNDEALARVIHACPLPIISGVGHETDFTIADFVADARAPTPSAAAALAVPDANEWLDRLSATDNRLQRNMQNRLEGLTLRVDGLARHLHAAHPRQRLQRQQDKLQQLQRHIVQHIHRRLQHAVHATQQLALRLRHRTPAITIQHQHVLLHNLAQRMENAQRTTLQRQNHRLQQAAARLHVLSPLATLDRGYALLEDTDGHIIKHTHALRPGMTMHARLHDGRVTCSVIALAQHTEKENNKNSIDQHPKRA